MALSGKIGGLPTAGCGILGGASASRKAREQRELEAQTGYREIGHLERLDGYVKAAGLVVEAECAGKRPADTSVRSG